MKDRSDDPSHHERTLLLRSYMSGQSVSRAHSELAVVAHACHGHRYRFLCPEQENGAPSRSYIMERDVAQR